MFYWKRVFLFALLCLALAGGIARAENEVTIRVTYTGSQTGDEPGVRVYLGTPLTENRPYAEYGTQYERGWLTFVSENTVYRYGMQGSSVVWMLPVSAKRGDVELYLDFAEGLGKDKAGLQYLKRLGVDGICTTRTNLVRIAKDLGLVTVQRFFMVDSHSVGTSLDSIRIAKPDIVEIMPAIVTKKIAEFSNLVDVPLIAGGLAETEEEVKAAIEAGANVVSTGETDLWSLELQ